MKRKILGLLLLILLVATRAEAKTAAVVKWGEGKVISKKVGTLKSTKGEHPILLEGTVLYWKEKGRIEGVEGVRLFIPGTRATFEGPEPTVRIIYKDHAQIIASGQFVFHREMVSEDGFGGLETQKIWAISKPRVVVLDLILNEKGEFHERVITR